MLPYPFSRIVFLWGEPLYIDRNLNSEEVERKRLELEQALIALTENADELACGK